MRLIHWNLYDGCVGDHARRERCAGWLCDQRPDIVTLNEANGWDARLLAAMALGWGHRHSRLMTVASGYHLAVTSALPMEPVAEHRDGFHHGALQVRVGGIDLIAVHLAPSQIDGARRRDEARRLADAARTCPGPVLVVGDLNGVAPPELPVLRPFLRETAWMLEGAQQAALIAAGLSDLSGDPPMAQSTVTSLRPEHRGQFGFRFDRAYGDAAMRARGAISRILADPVCDLGSDHRPMRCTWT